MENKDKENIDKSTVNQTVVEGKEELESSKDSSSVASPEEKLTELNDKYLRLYSEFDNFRKRTQKEKLDFFKYAGEDVISAILPVLDDLDRALKANSASTDKAFVDGIVLIQQKLLTILKQKGVEEVKTENEIFNTDMHEAITNIPAPSEDLKGKVIECVEKGYYLHGKVIRFAKVVVGA